VRHFAAAIVRNARISDVEAEAKKDDVFKQYLTLKYPELKDVDRFRRIRDILRNYNTNAKMHKEAVSFLKTIPVSDIPT
jgi:hypothetical protein